MPKEISSSKVLANPQAETESTMVRDIPNQPPQIVDLSFVPSQPVTGDSLKVKIKAYDSEGDAVNYSFMWQVNGETVQQSEENVLHYPLKDGDEVVVTVIPSDGKQKGKSVSNMVRVGNAPPSISLINQQVNGNIYQAQLKVNDPEGDKVSCFLKKAPQGMQINEHGLIIWPIGKGVSGKFSIEVEAQDEYGGKAILAFTVKVKRASQ